MKCQIVSLFAVVFVALVSADETQSQRELRIYRECQADPATFMDPKIGSKDKFHMEAYGRHALCIIVKFLQKPNGDIDKEDLKLIVRIAFGWTATRADTIVEKCGTGKSLSAHEAAITLHECFMRAS